MAISHLDILYMHFQMFWLYGRKHSPNRLNLFVRHQQLVHFLWFEFVGAFLYQLDGERCIHRNSHRGIDKLLT